MTQKERTQKTLEFRLIDAALEEHDVKLDLIAENQKEMKGVLDKMEFELFNDEKTGRVGKFSQISINTEFVRWSKRVLIFLTSVGSILLTAYAFNYFGDHTEEQTEIVKPKRK